MHSSLLVQFTDSFTDCFSSMCVVLPVAVAIMTPVIPLVILIFQKTTGRCGGEKKSKQDLLYSLPPDTELSISSSGSGTP